MSAQQSPRMKIAKKYGRQGVCFAPLSAHGFQSWTG